MLERRWIGWWRRGFRQNNSLWKNRKLWMGHGFWFPSQWYKGDFYNNTFPPLTSFSCSAQVPSVQIYFEYILLSWASMSLWGDHKGALLGLPSILLSPLWEPTNPPGPRRKLRPQDCPGVSSLYHQTAFWWQNYNVSPSMTFFCRCCFFLFTFFLLSLLFCFGI